MRQLSRTGYRRTAWKNGGGETVELAAFPSGAGLDDFMWRISMARIDCDGPFSRFQGIDRTILVHSGNGILLAFDGLEAVLRPGDPAFHFAGDAGAMCRLLDGPVTDINIMSRRSHARHSVSVLGPQTTILGRQASFLLALTSLRLDAIGELAPADLVAIDRDETLMITAGRALAVHFEPIEDQSTV